MKRKGKRRRMTNLQRRNLYSQTLNKKKEWKLPDELADVFEERCQSHMSEKELEVFLEIPVPKNINTPTKLDPFMKVWLEKKRLNRVVSVDEEMQRLQQKLYLVTGPLGRVWSSIQQYIQGNEEELDPQEVLTNLNASVVLLGQAINKIAYERRLTILAAVDDIKHAKRLLT